MTTLACIWLSKVIVLSNKIMPSSLVVELSILAEVVACAVTALPLIRNGKMIKSNSLIIVVVLCCKVYSLF